jgi:hypothetical protein
MSKLTISPYESERLKRLEMLERLEKPETPETPETPKTLETLDETGNALLKIANRKGASVKQIRAYLIYVYGPYSTDPKWAHRVRNDTLLIDRWYVIQRFIDGDSC